MSQLRLGSENAWEGDAVEARRGEERIGEGVSATADAGRRHPGTGYQRAFEGILQSFD